MLYSIVYSFTQPCQQIGKDSPCGCTYIDNYYNECVNDGQRKGNKSTQQYINENIERQTANEMTPSIENKTITIHCALVFYHFCYNAQLRFCPISTINTDQSI